jgi:hypothetical protein
VTQNQAKPDKPNTAQSQDKPLPFTDDWIGAMSTYELQSFIARRALDRMELALQRSAKIELRKRGVRVVE